LKNAWSHWLHPSIACIQTKVNSGGRLRTFRVNYSVPYLLLKCCCDFLWHQCEGLKENSVGRLRNLFPNEIATSCCSYSEAKMFSSYTGMAYTNRSVFKASRACTFPGCYKPFLFSWWQSAFKHIIWQYCKVELQTLFRKGSYFFS
jgi:hypothetical protein